MEAPPKSALKSKKRQSLLVVTTPPASRHVSISQSPDSSREVEAIQRNHNEISSVVEEEESLPEHHRVLYELLGTDKAESILNPKIEEPTKKTEEKEEQQEDMRKLPTVDTCLGADALWEILKNESDKKLFKMDKKIPVDWKLSYGAYVRNNISQNRALVERSFTHHADVPELDKLLDQRYKDRVLKARHHANVMYRSSENNKNRTTLLLGNNPVPDYNDRDGHERLGRYFTQQIPSLEANKPLPLPPVTPRENRPISRQFTNLHFLTENRARTKGRFYDKYATVDAVKMVTDIPGYRVQLPPSMKERVAISAPVHDLSGLRPLDGHRRLFTPRPPIRRDPTWQPLTVGALMEYTSSKYVLGYGEFRYGQPTRWRTQAAPATA